MAITKHLQIAEKQRCLFEKDNNNIALFIIGGVARNEYFDMSDLDLLLITRESPTNTYKEFQENNVMVEIKANTVSHYLEKMTLDPKSTYQFLEAKVLFDKDSCLNILQQKAHSVLRDYKYDDIPGLIKWLSGTAIKIKRAVYINDKGMQGYYCSNILGRIMMALYVVNKLPPPPSTLSYTKIKSLKKLPVNFTDIWSKACSGNLNERIDAVLKLIDYCLVELTTN